jgi:hypothetical protein
MKYSQLNKRPDFRICNNMEKGRKISISRGRKRGGEGGGGGGGEGSTMTG